jgi:hypothetical protein
VLVALDRQKKNGRRRLVWGLAALAALAAGGGAALAVSRDREADRARARDLAESAYAAMRSGDIARARALAEEARKIDPKGREAATAWLHATGLHLIDGDGTAADAVGYMDQVRRLGARGALVAFAVLASAVAMKNDKLATTLLEEQSGRGVGGDAFHAFAVGAALDLACSDGAAASYQDAADRWADAVLPRIRRARAFLLADNHAAAESALAELPEGRPEVRVLRAALRRLEAAAGAPAYVDPFAATDLPRSVRAIAQALTVGKETETAGLDVALDDVDTPLVALLCGRLALSAGDVDGASHAVDTALRMRPELDRAARLGTRLALSRGDLERASKVAEESTDAESKHLVRAIRGYEDKKADVVRDEVLAAFDDGASTWALASTARALLGDGPPLDPAGAALAHAADEPWSAELAFDAALARGDLAKAQTTARGWDAAPAPRKSRFAALKRAESAAKP